MNTKHSKEKSCSKQQARLEPTPLNVTQAAVYKGEMERTNYNKERKKEKKRKKSEI